MQTDPVLLKKMTGKEIDGDRFLASIARAYLLDDAKLSWVISGSILFVSCVNMADPFA
jgi:hypothetical protein